MKKLMSRENWGKLTLHEGLSHFYNVMESWERKMRNKTCFECLHCDWKQVPGSFILCDDVKKGPYYCPDCKKELKILWD